jgi:hypothetical protein
MLHVQHILKDSRVSAAIYTFPEPEGGNLGLQLRGTAHHLREASDGWQHFTITPDEVWVFDSRVYGKERRRVNLSQLSLGQGKS